MMASTFLMLCISVLLILAFFPDFFGETGGLPEGNEENYTSSFDDTSFLYYLNSDQVKSAIQEGISSLSIIDAFLLDREMEDDSLKSHDHVEYAYIVVPELEVMRKAKRTNDQFSRNIKALEATQSLTDQFLIFEVRFEKQFGYIYNITFEQDHELIEPELIEHNAKGALTRVYFNIEQIDIDHTGLLHVTDRANADERQSFHVEFNDFLPRKR